MKLGCRVLSLLSICALIDGAKILGVLPIGSKSHFAIGHSILKSLLEAGHDITVITPFPLKKPPKNFKEINTEDIVERYKKEKALNPFDIGKLNPILGFAFLYKMGSDYVQQYMEHPEVLKFMESKETFDVCLIESFNIDALNGIADHFGCILISYTTFGAVKWIDDMTSNQSPYSYVPQPFLRFTDKMTFTERLTNTFCSVLENILYGAFHLPNQRKLYKKYFPNAKKSFDEMYKSNAILFLNNHVSSSSPRPYLPNMIEIGGIHVEPVKPLPNDIQQFLDDAPDGVILFSMGSFIQSKDWVTEKREAFVSAFGKLKQKVLWKYENETLPGKPENVKIGSWIPQRDIVAHPNVKLFITHGGLLGTTEALVEGVPVLGIPIFGDQKMNMAKAVGREYGLQVYYDEISEENISNALNELLNNPKYSKNAKEISRRFVDRPLSPQQTVVYWTEYAIRHKGAPHLKAAGNDLNFFEFHLIDVYSTMFLIFLVTLLIGYLILNFIIRKCLKPKTKKDKEKKN